MNAPRWFRKLSGPPRSRVLTWRHRSRITCAAPGAWLGTAAGELWRWPMGKESPQRIVAGDGVALTWLAAHGDRVTCAWADGRCATWDGALHLHAEIDARRLVGLVARGDGSFLWAGAAGDVWASLGEAVTPFVIPRPSPILAATGDAILAGADGTLRFLSLSEQTHVVRLPAPALKLAGNAGHVLALTTAGDVCHVHGAQVTTLPRARAETTALAVLPGGVLVTGHRLTWDDGQPVGEVVAHSGGAERRLRVLCDTVLSLDALADGRVAIAGADGQVVVWDAGDDRGRVVSRHDGPVTQLSASAAILSASGTTARLWLPSLADHAIPRTLLARPWAVLADGRRAFFDDKETLQIADPSGTLTPSHGSTLSTLAQNPRAAAALGLAALSFPGRAEGIRALTYLGDAGVAIAFATGRVHVVRRGAPPAELPGADGFGRITCLAAAAHVSSWRIAAGYATGHVVAYHGVERQPLRPHAAAVLAVAVLPDGRVASAAEDGSLWLRDPAGTIPDMTYSTEEPAVSLAFDAAAFVLTCGLRCGAVVRLGIEPEHGASRPAPRAALFEPPSTIILGKAQPKADELFPHHVSEGRLDVAPRWVTWRTRTPDGRVHAVRQIALPEGFDFDLLARYHRATAGLPHSVRIDHVARRGDSLALLSAAPAQTLRERFNARPAHRRGLPRQELLVLLDGVAEALDDLWQRHGLAHLDVCPINVWLDEGRARLCGWGLTPAGLPPSVPLPEGERDGAADQYCLARLYHHHLTGRALSDDPDLLGLHPDERAAVRRALDADPRRRFASCRSLLVELRRAAGGIAEPDEPARERVGAPVGMTRTLFVGGADNAADEHAALSAVLRRWQPALTRAGLSLDVIRRGPCAKPLPQSATSADLALFFVTDRAGLPLDDRDSTSDTFAHDRTSLPAARVRVYCRDVPTPGALRYGSLDRLSRLLEADLSALTGLPAAPDVVPDETSLRAIAARCRTLTLPGGQSIDLAEAFVIPVGFADAFAAARCLLVQGEAGSGKTTLLRWLALRAAEATLSGAADARVPVFLASALDESLDADARAHLRAGRALVLLDDLDEADATRVSAFVEDWIVPGRLAQGNRLVVTSRAALPLPGTAEFVLGSMEGVLTSNPLLATAIALAHRNNQTLPTRRDELIEAAISTLAARWRDDLPPLADVMGPVAWHLHGHRPDGLIARAELVERLRAATPHAVAAVLRGDAGVFAARAQSYGFLHPTIQEYYAACELLRDRAAAAAKILDRLAEPRWRETLSLALALACRTWPASAFQALLTELLDAPAAPLPGAAWLIAEAVPDVPPRVVAQLLAAWATADLPPLRTRIETALAHLRRRAPDATDAAFIEALADPARAAAAADLLRRQTWYSPALAAALASAVAHDDEARGWPIASALLELHSPPVPPRPLAVDRPLTEAQLAKKKRSEADAIRERQRALLKTLPILKLREESRTPLAFPVPTRLHAALLAEPHLLERLSADVEWLAVLGATCGGFADHQADSIQAEHARLAALLLSPDGVREAALSQQPEEYVGRFGATDPFFEMARYLDNKFGGRAAHARAPVTFAASALWRDSSLTPLFLDALRAGATADSLRESLRASWHGGDVEALVALIVLGESDFDFDDPRCRKRLAQAAHGLRDAVVRAVPLVLSAVAELARDPSQGYAPAMTLLRAISRAATVPPDLSSIIAAPPLRGVLLADAWHRLARGVGIDDPLVAANGLCDAMTGEMIAEMLAAAHLAPSRRADPEAWPLATIEALRIAGLSPAQNVGIRERLRQRLPDAKPRALAPPPARVSLRHALAAHAAAAPQAWAAVFAFAALSDVAAAEAPDDWERLQSPQRTNAIRNFLDRGEERGLPLTPAAARTLAHVPDDALTTLLPLIDPAPGVPVPAEWLTHPDARLRRHAELLRAEPTRRLDPESIPALAASLGDGPDRTRLRAQLVLWSDVFAVEKPSRGLHVSRVGRETLDALAAERAALRERGDVAAARGLYKVLGDVSHDDPAALLAWADDASRGGPRAAHALWLLANVEELSDEAWPAFRRLIGEPQPLAVRKALARSLCALAYLDGKLPASRWQEMQPELDRFRRADWSGGRLFLTPDVAIVESLHAARSAAPGRRAALAESALAGVCETFASLLSRREDELLRALRQLGERFYVTADDPRAELAVKQVTQEPALFAVLCEWLPEALAGPAEDDGWHPKLDWLLRIAAPAAERLPEAFLRHAESDAGRWRALLSRAVRRQDGAHGRRAAVALLGCLREATPAVAEAFRDALRDVPIVQDAAIRAAERFAKVDEALEAFVELLEDESAQTAFGAARVLAALGRSPDRPAAQRRRIVAALVEALRRPTAWRSTYRLLGRGDEREPARVGRGVRLAEAFAEALLEVSGWA